MHACAVIAQRPGVQFNTCFLLVRNEQDGVLNSHYPLKLLSRYNHQGLEKLGSFKCGSENRECLSFDR